MVRISAPAWIPPWRSWSAPQSATQTQVPVLPLLPYGCSLGHSRRWPGTIALSPQTLIALVTEIGDWVHASGFRRFFIVNSHVTNAAPLRCALEVLRSRYDDLLVAVVNTATLSPRVARAFSADAADWHANAAETSLMLAVAPALVRPQKIRTRRRSRPHARPGLRPSRQSHEHQRRHRPPEPGHRGAGPPAFPLDGRRSHRTCPSRAAGTTTARGRLRRTRSLLP